jgi:uncharacterized membrane protein
MIAKGSWLSATLLGLFILLTDLHIASKRLLWFDEINTLQIAQLPDVATLWQVQNSFRGDSPPITYHLLVRLIYHLTGKAETAVRLLSTLAMIAALLVVFDCARRLTDGISGLLAMGVLASSFLAYYGYEGRPYTLVVLFTAIALWLWLHTKQDSNLAAVAFGATIFLTVTVQFTGVLALVPFGIWEVYHWRPWRRPSSKLVSGAVAVACAVAVCLPQMKHSAGWAGTSWCPPSVTALATVWSTMFPSGLFVLAILVILIGLMRTPAQPVGNAELLCWLFLTIPIAGYFLAVAVTNAFYNRYLIATLPGVGVAFGCLVSRYLNRPASIALLVFVAALVAGRQIGHARHPEGIEPPSVPNAQLYTRECLAAEGAIAADGKKVIVTYFTLVQSTRYYSKRPDLYAMYEGDDFRPYCKYFGTACWTLDAVKGHAAEVAAVYPSDRFLTEMSRAGFQPTVKMTNPTVVYFSPR